MASYKEEETYSRDVPGRREVLGWGALLIVLGMPFVD